MCVNCGVSSCSSCNTDSYIPSNTSALKYDGPKFVCPSDFTVLPGAPLNDMMNTLMEQICTNASSVDSVTGLDTDNTDPENPIVQIAVDGVTITGEGTPASPLVSVGGGGGTGLFKEVRVPISAAEILNIHNVRKELLPAQSGIAYEIQSINLVLIKVATDYATTIANDNGFVSFRTGPGGFDESEKLTISAPLTNLNTLIALGYTSWILNMKGGVGNNPQYQFADNMNIELGLLPAAGVFTLGDHTMEAVVTYRDITI
jgi:hypothetical protein